MSLPIVTGDAFHRPSVLNGQPNGQLPSSLLTTIAMPGGGTAVVLAQCAPKWLALLDAAARAGFRFGQNGDYRPLAEQKAIFLDRYQTAPIKGATTKTWQGQVWYLRPGEAVAATPGTSNHGWALALDLSMAGGDSLTDAAVAWLCVHAAEFGISAEIKSENWHWRPYDGDHYTAAVLSYMEEDEMHLVRDDSGMTCLATGALAGSGKYAALHITSQDILRSYEVLALKTVQMPKGVTIEGSGLYDVNPAPFPAAGGATELKVELTGTAKPIAG